MRATILTQVEDIQHLHGSKMSVVMFANGHQAIVHTDESPNVGDHVSITIEWGRHLRAPSTPQSTEPDHQIGGRTTLAWRKWVVEQAVERIKVKHPGAHIEGVNPDDATYDLVESGHRGRYHFDPEWDTL